MASSRADEHRAALARAGKREVGLTTPWEKRASSFDKTSGLSCARRGSTFGALSSSAMAAERERS